MSLARSLRPARRSTQPHLEILEERAVPTLLGNQLFPADNPWNQSIANAPVAANSATLVAKIGATSHLHPDFGTTWAGAFIGIPYNVVSATQPKVNVVIDAYPDESDLVPVPIPANAVLEGDPLPSAQNTSDRHLLVYDKDNNFLYELYNAHRPSETSDGQWHADSEAVWNLNQDSFRPAGWTSADAAGLPILPGLVTYDEVYTQGVINHALRFTVPSTGGYVFPASHLTGNPSSSLPRMGERFRLDPNFDISGFSKPNQVILQALKTYGMIVADNGSSWYLSGAPDPRWNDDDLHALNSIPGSAFQAVDLTPEVSGLSASSGPAGSAITVSGLNFSGGAGQTQVLFGTTPATGVTINSDSSLTVTAPAGATGTVDVTVQSPYGKSPAIAADHFTYASTPTPTPTPTPAPTPMPGPTPTPTPSPATPPPAPTPIPTLDPGVILSPADPSSAPEQAVQPGALQFSQGSYQVSAGAGRVTITIVRSGGSNGAVSAHFLTSDGSAHARADYRPLRGTLTFAAGATSATITIPLLNSQRSGLWFWLSLTNPTGGATLGSPSRAKVQIGSAHRGHVTAANATHRVVKIGPSSRSHVYSFSGK